MMKPRRSVLPFAGILLCGLSLRAPADDKPAAAPGQDEMTKAWMAYATPGPGQKALEATVGTWDVQSKFWMAPGAPPQESTGTSENRMILGGRYLEQRYEGTMMGQPFSGIGVTAFDNYKKKYIASWIDTAGTGIMVTTGIADKAGKVITSWGTMDDPGLGKTVKVKTVVTIVDADHHTYESWGSGPDGKMAKSLEIHFTRKK
jgi:hypothetical protein